MLFCREKKSKAEALESQMALYRELKGMKKDNKLLSQKIYSPVNPEEGKTCTCKEQGVTPPCS